MNERNHTLLQQGKDSLGGRCVACGTVNDLEFDHIDPVTKAGEVTTILYTRNLAEFWAEVAKCQLLCGDHHREKTRRDRQHRGIASS